MGIGLFLLLPDAKEVWEDWAKANIKDEHMQELPYAFFVSFFAYSFMLFVEKVLFSTPSLIHGISGEAAHSHNHEDHNHARNLILEEGKSDKNIQLKSVDHGNAEDADSDEDEEAFKNVVSAKGKFASFLGMRNCK